jgi:CheY-like chemotaxis protein
MQHGSTHNPLRPVLIVDDVASDAMTLDLLCRSLGLETICTASTAEAAAVLTRTRPAAIITNLVMLAADGLECLFVIAEHAPTIPVMIITGSDKSLLEAASNLGENYCLRNFVCVECPIGINTLRAFVTRSGLPSSPSQWDLH